MKTFNRGSRLANIGSAVALAGVLGLGGCGTPPPPDGLAEAAAMGERPVAMQGKADFFDGQVTATVSVSRGIGRGAGGGGGGPGSGGSQGRTGRGGRGGGGRQGGPPPDLAGMELEEAMAYQRSRMALGSPLPPVTTRLKLENHSQNTFEVEILEVNSDLGNFAVRPAKLSLAPGQTAEPDPMISQLGVTSDEIPVKVTLRKIGGEGVKQTQTVAVVSLHRTDTPEPKNKD